MAREVVAIIEHDPSDPPGPLARWLEEAGVDVEVLRPHAGDALPADPSAYAGIVLLGGSQAAYSDDGFAWRAATLEMLQRAASQNIATLGLCLGGQLIAQAFGGVVERGSQGMEVGAMQAGRKDRSYQDELFDVLPMAPDVIHFHRDAIAELPPGATHLMGGPLYDNQAFRVGERVWAAQFHIETTPEVFEAWVRKSEDYLRHKGFDTERLVERSNLVHPELEEVWAPFMRRFAEIAAGGRR